MISVTRNDIWIWPKFLIIGDLAAAVKSLKALVFFHKSNNFEVSFFWTEQRSILWFLFGASFKEAFVKETLVLIWWWQWQYCAKMQAFQIGETTLTFLLETSKLAEKTHWQQIETDVWLGFCWQQRRWRSVTVTRTGYFAGKETGETGVFVRSDTGGVRSSSVQRRRSRAADSWSEPVGPTTDRRRFLGSRDTGWVTELTQRSEKKWENCARLEGGKGWRRWKQVMHGSL